MTQRLPRHYAARKRARDVLTENGISNYPVIPEDIAKGFPLPLLISESDGFPPRAYGALYKGKEGFRILVARNCPTDGHRRFTLCHELGHFFLDDHLDAVFESSAEYHMSDTDHFRGLRKPWYEAEADTFASELLVPTNFLRPVVAGQKPTLTLVTEIANSFRCSTTCAAIRLAELTVEPVAIVLSMDGVVEWTSFSEPMRAHSWSAQRLKGEWAPPESSTQAVAANPSLILDGGTAAGDGLVAEWFDGAPVTEVFEEAMGLGGYGRVLTLLWCPELPSPESHEAATKRTEVGPQDWRDAARPFHWDSYEDDE